MLKDNFLISELLMREELIGIMSMSWVMDNRFKEIWKTEVMFTYRYPGKDPTGIRPIIKVLGSLNPGLPCYNTTHRYTGVNWPSLHHCREAGAQRKSVRNIDSVATSIAD